MVVAKIGSSVEASVSVGTAFIVEYGLARPVTTN